jgi:ABC-type transport system involved in multi-copper enzyme maturation permease subunit
MPVYERGYKHWERSGQKAAPPWWVIARRGIAGPLKRRGLLILLMVAWVPAIVKGGILFFMFKMGKLVELFGGSWVDINPPGFLEFLKWQKYFVLIFLTIVGTRLIAKDRAENGLALYFARPLSLTQYIAGKALIVLFFYFLVTLFPVYALSIFGYLVTAGQTKLDMLLLIPLRATLFCTLTGASMSLILLAMSCLGKREVFITVGWVLFYLGSQGAAQMLSLFGGRAWGILDFPAQYFQAGAALFGAEPRAGYSPWASLLVIVLMTLLAIWVLRQRIRPVEVVA